MFRTITDQERTAREHESVCEALFLANMEDEAARGKYSLPRSSKIKKWGVKFDLPERVAEKAGTFLESGYYAIILTLVLKDGGESHMITQLGAVTLSKQLDPKENLCYPS